MTGPELEKSIRLLEDARYTAMLAGDTAALGALLSQRLVYAHSGGERDNKSSYLDRISEGGLRYESIEHAIDRIIASDNMVVLIGEMSANVLVLGEARAMKCVTLAVWVREDEWRLAAYQPTPASEHKGEIAAAA